MYLYNGKLFLKILLNNMLSHVLYTIQLIKCIIEFLRNTTSYKTT